MCDFIQDGSETDRVQTEKTQTVAQKLRRWSETGVIFRATPSAFGITTISFWFRLDRKRVFLRFMSIIALIMTKWDI